jgi:hypothetical protein
MNIEHLQSTQSCTAGCLIATTLSDENPKEEGHQTVNSQGSIASVLLSLPAVKSLSWQHRTSTTDYNSDRFENLQWGRDKQTDT